MTTHASPPSRHWKIWMLGVLVAYAALVVPTVTRQGISWDEQTDLTVARGYVAHGWLTASDVDPSQTRLPMAVVALAWATLGTSDLVTARLVSVAAGGLTLLGLFIYARRHFGLPQAVVACALLASSPFFLSFTRVAGTEGDIYPACALIWLLLALTEWHETATLRHALLAGVLLGLAISAKFITVSVLPLVWYVAVSAKPAGRTATSTPTFLAAVATALAVITFFLIPPEHLTNPKILLSVASRAGNEMGINLSFMFEVTALHVLSLLFKSTPLIGSGLLLSVALSAAQWRRTELRLPLLMAALYFGGLVILPIAQTFYLVPLLPILSLFAADQLVGLWRRHSTVAAGLVAIAAVGWCIDLVRCYPDYNLNGYQYLGARPLAGRSSIGYRSVVQTPSDGIQQSIEWLNLHAGAGDHVTAYVSPWDIVTAYAPHPRYQIVDGMNGSPFTSPEYVVTHIDNQLAQGWDANDTPADDVWSTPYDPTWLAVNYDEVFRVVRAFDLTVASVWRRR